MAHQIRARWTFAIVSVAWFAFALDRLVVATALPSIRTDLGADTAGLEWIVNAYTLSFAVLLTTGAALGDRFGRRRMFTTGMAVFTVGSGAAALAPDVAALVAARAVQGVGGAIFTPLMLTMLARVTPAHRRGTVLGAWGAIGGLGAALGPLVGGALAGGAGWRWIFWLNVPLGLALVPLARVRLDESHGPRQRLDVVGAVLCSIGLLGVVSGVIRAGSVGWTNTGQVATAAVGLLALFGFVAWELRAPTPMLPLRFFGNRVFAVAGAAALMMYAALFGALFLVTQFLQIGLGASPVQAGLRTLPMAVMPMVLAPVGGRLSDRFGFRPLMISGLALVAVGLAWLAATASPHVHYAALVPGQVLTGAGSALFFAPLAAAVLSSVTADEQGKA
ncbi:MAG TPA: DHA2 family efflux MFS transporter permease subunit, partial [Jatrophihabitantaceae bacterium]